MENPTTPHPVADLPSVIDPAQPPRAHSRRSVWFGRVLLVIVWFAFYAALEHPFDSWLIVLTAIAFGLWVYDRVCGRMRLPPVKVRFERVERVTLTHILLALLLLVLYENHSQLLEANTGLRDIQTGLVNAQNAASEDADDIKSSLDDVKTAIEENR